MMFAVVVDAAKEELEGTVFAITFPSVVFLSFPPFSHLIHEPQGLRCARLNGGSSFYFRL